MLAAVWVSACAHRGAGRPEAPLAAPARPWIAGNFSAQSLFRVDVDGPEGSGRMRLVLRDDPAAPEEDFHLAASDVVGRPLWTLAASGSRLGLVDHRRRAFCGTGSDVTLPEVGLAALPAAALPRLLRGQLPVAAPSRVARGEIDFRDTAERRWTATLEEGEPVRWTLWGEGRPILWWKRQEGGGVLSHRSGRQFRWRSSVSEQREGRFVLTVPEDYHASDCATWDLSQLRQDQPAPAGDRPAR